MAHWHLFHLTTQQTFQNLSFSEANKKIQQGKKEEWYCWQPQFVDWKPVREVSDFMPVSSKKAVPPPPPPARAFKTADIQTSETQTSEKRKHPRHNVQLKVIIVKGSSAFKTMTVDISEGGLRLNKPLPQTWLDSDCDIFIFHPASNRAIKISSRLVGTGSIRSRLTFADNHALHELKQWIESLSKKKTEPRE